MALLRVLYYLGGALAVLAALVLVVGFVAYVAVHGGHAGQTGLTGLTGQTSLTGMPGQALVVDQPAGLEYVGPNTTAVAGWYCVEELNSTPLPGQWGLQVPAGYGVQLNARLSNGVWVQDVMSMAQCVGCGYVWNYASEYWLSINTTVGNVTILPGPATCGWLVIAVVNGTAYTGYSLDGKSVTWFYGYPVGDATIVPSDLTGLVLGGPGFDEGLNITRALVYLAMYFWNGTAWEPAPVRVVPWGGGTAEWVSEAWVYTGGKACGVVSWPKPVNTTECPGPPGFSPYPRS